MDYPETPQIHTARLLLRRLTPADAGQMFENWAADPAVTLHLTWPPYETEDAVRQWLMSVEEAYDSYDRYTWGIVEKESGALIGTIGAHGFDESDESCEVGYVIGSRWWGCGYMTEALSSLLGFLFSEVGAETVRACHHPENPASARVMEKCGMRPAPNIHRVVDDNSGSCEAVFREISYEKWEEMASKTGNDS